MKFKIKIQQFITLLQEWLGSSGFEQGWKDKDLVAPVAVAVALLLAGFWFGAKASARRQAALARIGIMETAAQSMEQYRSLTALWAAIKQNDLLSAGKDPTDWIQVQISSYAKSENMEVVSFSPGGSQSLGSLKWQHGSFQIRGSYHAIGRFIARVEDSKPFLGLSSFSLSRNFGRGSEGEGVVITAQMDIFALMETAPAASKSGGS